jgi:TolB-like protein/DNA-binding winged helix-turn-helix (wHTH) protein
VSAHTFLVSRYRFGEFELDIRLGELRKRGVRLPLKGQPLQVLAVLLQHSGELVTRDDLREQIWPADTFVDFDHSLHNAIARLREVLGDSAQTPRFVETLPRRGYRFIGKIEESERNFDEQMDCTRVPLNAIRNLTMTFAVSLLAFAAIAAGVRVNRLSAPERLKRSAIRSVAVLPFENLSGDPAQEYFADSMTEELITDIAKENSLALISRTSVMRYKGATTTLPEIARELKVDGIVEGSVVRAGNNVCIRVVLVYAPTERHLWAETYEREVHDVLGLQREVGLAIAKQVQVRSLSLGADDAPSGYRLSGQSAHLSLGQYVTSYPADSARANQD